MRIAEAEMLGLRQAQAAEEIDGIAPGVVLAGDLMADRGLHALVDQLVGRIEGSRGRLRHIGHARTPEKPALCLARLHQIRAVEAHCACRDAATRPGIAHGSKPDRRFAGARFADQPQHLAAAKSEVDALDDRMPALLASAFDAEPFDLQQHARRARSRRGSCDAPR